MKIRCWPKTGSEAQHFKLKEIFKSLLNKYFRWFYKAPLLSSYFCCQTSPVSPRGLGSVRAWTDPDPDSGWFSESSSSMVRLTPKVWKQKRRFLKLSKYPFNTLYKKCSSVEVHNPRSGFFWPKKPDPNPWFVGFHHDGKVPQPAGRGGRQAHRWRPGQHHPRNLVIIIIIISTVFTRSIVHLLYNDTLYKNGQDYLNIQQLLILQNKKLP